MGSPTPEVAAILDSTRAVTVLGASDDPRRPSHGVAAYLLNATPYDVSFVNPTLRTLFGRPVHASLADLPAAPDLVCVFRRDEHLPGVFDEAITAGARTLWLQLGLRRDDVARRATAAGLRVVMDRCLKNEHLRHRS